MSERINGYNCRTCADVALAQRGLDPTRSVESQRIETEEKGRRETVRALGQNQPGAPGAALGSRLDLLA
jgi:hypothetical protein